MRVIVPFSAWILAVSASQAPAASSVLELYLLLEHNVAAGTLEASEYLDVKQGIYRNGIMQVKTNGCVITETHDKGERVLDLDKLYTPTYDDTGLTRSDEITSLLGPVPYIEWRGAPGAVTGDTDTGSRSDDGDMWVVRSLDPRAISAIFPGVSDALPIEEPISFERQLDAARQLLELCPGLGPEPTLQHR
jgi:hypothetical protein